MSQERDTRERAMRRLLLKGAAAASALSAVPFISARAQSKAIKIGIPTVITGGYALLGSQVQRTCRLVQKNVNAKGGVIGRPVEFLFQDTAGDPAPAVRKSQERVERDRCRILTRVIVSFEAAAMLPKLQAWHAVVISHGYGD